MRTKTINIIYFYDRWTRKVTGKEQVRFKSLFFCKDDLNPIINNDNGVW